MKALKYYPYVIWLALLVLLSVTQLSHWRPQARVLYEAWGWAQSCTADLPAALKNPHGDLAHVRWGTFTPGAFNDSLPGSVIGQTVRYDSLDVDSIYIDTAHQDTVWVLAHELVHHILIDPDKMGSAHPFFPFAFPCHLLQFQQPGASPVGG